MNFKKSLWQQRLPGSWSFYCPLCGQKKHLKSHPRLNSWRLALQVSLTALVFAGACSLFMGAAGWRAGVIFFPLWTGVEIWHRLNTRKKVTCLQCGFDPYLYLIQEQLAKKEVEAYWRQKFASKNRPYPERVAARPSRRRQNPDLGKTP